MTMIDVVLVLYRTSTPEVISPLNWHVGADLVAIELDSTPRRLSKVSKACTRQE